MDQTDTAVTHRLLKEGRTAFDTLFRNHHLYTDSVVATYADNLFQARFTHLQIDSSKMGRNVHNRFHIIR